MGRKATFAVLGLLALSLPGRSQAQERYTLDDLLRLGRERNPTILALRDGRSAAAASRKAESRWENPALEYAWGSGEPRGGGADRYISEISVSQILENPVSRHYRLGALEALAGAAGEELREGILEVDYEIRMHFYRILFLEEMVALARLNEGALAEIRGLIETRARVGEVRELEAIRLRVEYLRARNEAEAVELELDQYHSLLNTFLGNVLPEGFRLTGSLEPARPEPDLDRLTREVLPAHPRLQAAAREREAAEQRLGESRFGWIPDPVLSGSSRRELDGTVRTLGIGLQVPLWNQSRAATEESHRRVDLLAHREEALRLEMEANLMIHHNHLRLLRQTLELFQDGLLQEADQSMEIAESSYRAGEISFIEYLDARRTYHSIQIQYQQALFDWNAERAMLDLAAGGGTLS